MLVTTLSLKRTDRLTLSTKHILMFIYFDIEKKTSTIKCNWIGLKTFSPTFSIKTINSCSQHRTASHDINNLIIRVKAWYNFFIRHAFSELIHWTIKENKNIQIINWVSNQFSTRFRQVTYINDSSFEFHIKHLEHIKMQ